MRRALLPDPPLFGRRQRVYEGCSTNGASMNRSRARLRPSALEPTSRRGRTAFLGGVLLPLALLSALAFGATRAGGIPFDAEVLRYAERHYNAAAVDPLDTGLTVSLGVAAAVTTALVIVQLARRKYREAAFWALALGGVLVLDIPLKEIFHRPALGGEGYSFPSGNAMASAAMLVAVVATTSSRRRRLAVAVGVPVLVAYGVALVYAWWHYPGDVVAGWCVALAWVTALRLALRYERHR